MRLNENEMNILTFIANSGGVIHPRDISQAFGQRPETASRRITHLTEKGLVEREHGGVVLAKSQPAESFKRLYYAHRASPFQVILAGRRIDLLSTLDNNPKSVEDLAGETGIPIKTVYYYLKDLIRLGIVKKTKNGKGFVYSFNYTLWEELKDFVTSLLESEGKQLIPRAALLIKGYVNSVLFKSLRQLDAVPTSFSAYGQYGIELDLRDYYYTLPKRELPIKDVFVHSLDSAESLSHRLYCILFYLKNKGKLRGIKHPMMKKMRAVLRGEGVKGYPSLEDVKDRAGLYGIEL